MNARASLLWGLVAVFAPLSLVTVGGGQAVVADYHRQVVDLHGWLSETDFVNAFAVSRMAPGPGTLLVTLIGWHVAGFWGAVVATLAIFVPAALLIYGVAHIWRRSSGARWQRALEAGLRPVAAGMILASVYVLLGALEGGWTARVIALASTAVLMLTPINPLLLLASGAAVFVALQAVLPG
jgi:chromate transporter